MNEPRGKQRGIVRSPVELHSGFNAFLTAPRGGALNPSARIICGIDEAGRGPLAGPVCAAAVALPPPEQRPPGLLALLADSKKLKAGAREEARAAIVEVALAWGVGWASHAEIDELNILQASLLAMRRAFACLLAAPPALAPLASLAAPPAEPLEEPLAESEPPLAGRPRWPESIADESPFGSPFCAGAFGSATGSDIGSAGGGALGGTFGGAFPEGLSAIADGMRAPELPIPCAALVKADAKVPEVMAASILAKTARDRLMERYAALYPQYGYERHKGYPTAEHRRLVLEHGPSPIQRRTFRVVC